MRSNCYPASCRFHGLTFWSIFTFATLFASQAFASVTVTAPLAGVVNSPFLLRAQATSCSSQPTASMAYSIDDHTDTLFKGATSLDTDVSAAAGPHTLHVKAWGNAGALCKTDVLITVGGGVTVSAPQRRVVVNSPFLLRAQATTCGGQPTTSMAYSFDSLGDTLVSGATSIDRTISVSNGSHILRVKAWG